MAWNPLSSPATAVASTEYFPPKNFAKYVPQLRSICILDSRMRQGCVLSSRLFSSVLEIAFARWPASVEDSGLDLCDGGPALFDFRFAEDILVFGTTYHVEAHCWAKLWKIWRQWAYTWMWMEQGSWHDKPSNPQDNNTQWIDHINYWPGNKPQVAWLHANKYVGEIMTSDADHRLQSAAKVFAKIVIGWLCRIGSCLSRSNT